MIYAEMIVMLDSIFSNSEDDSENSNQSTSLPPSASALISTSQLTSSIATHTININYHYSHSIHERDREDLNILSLLQKLSDITSIQTLSNECSISQASVLLASAAPQLKSKTKTLNMRARLITFITLDLLDSPHISFATDIRELLRC
jgi:hypothetical protein